MLELARFPDWPARLEHVIAQHQAAPFVWGQTDCATLWTEAVAAMTGVDLAAEFAPWRDEASALRSLAARGFASVRDYVASLLPEVPRAFAGRGDLGFPRADCIVPLSSPAVIVGQYAVSRNPERWVVLPRRFLVTCFRV